MSMFKSLQLIPGTVTVFHSSKNPISLQLLEYLQKNSIPGAKPKTATRSIFQKLTSSSSDERPSLYQLDVSESLPTKNQYSSIRDSMQMHNQNKEAFLKAFPSFEFKDIGLLPSMEDYSVRQQNNQVNFKPPLVVDWDHGLLATDQEGVQRIVDVFKDAKQQE